MSASLDRGIIDELNGFPNAPTVMNEALFGYRHVKPYLDRLPPGARVLEIGAGPCVLLSQLAADYPALALAGVEPIGPGFDLFRPILERLTRTYGFTLHQSSYEVLPEEPGFDLIYLVNVFEHLPDWRAFLLFAKARLNPGGRCVVLCPNYAFPYESHFRLPIIVNKRVTHALFRGRIARFERDQDHAGLWQSLNMVRMGAVKRFCRRNGLAVRNIPAIVAEMIERLDSDPAFKQRQALIGAAATFFRRIGLLRLLSSGAMENIHPYMQLELTRAA